jgi:hypothetical protein
MGKGKNNKKATGTKGLKHTYPLNGTNIIEAIEFILFLPASILWILALSFILKYFGVK